MPDDVRIQTRRIEHTTRGPQNAQIWEVDLVIPCSGIDAVVTISIFGSAERDIADINAEARRELHRISSRIAANGVAGAAPEDPPEQPKKRRPDQSSLGSPWA